MYFAQNPLFQWALCTGLLVLFQGFGYSSLKCYACEIAISIEQSQGGSMWGGSFSFDGLGNPHVNKWRNSTYKKSPKISSILLKVFLSLGNPKPWDFGTNISHANEDTMKTWIGKSQPGLSLSQLRHVTPLWTLPTPHTILTVGSNRE